MRPESKSSDKADSLKEEGREHSGGVELEEFPKWKIVEAGKDCSLIKDFAEPVMVSVTKLVKLSLEDMAKQLEKDRRHGRSR